MAPYVENESEAQILAIYAYGQCVIYNLFGVRNAISVNYQKHAVQCV